MRTPTWRIDDEDGDPDLAGTPRAVLVTGRALANALRRTWPVWCAAALVGAILGAWGFQLVPRQVEAKATLLMVSATPDDASAMTTDVSLLQTRAVGTRVVDQLGLRESPDEFLSTVTVTPVSGRILDVSVTAPTAAAAVTRATSLIDNFLAFRGEQLRSISDGLVTGYARRVSSMQVEVDDLTREYGRVSAQQVPDQIRLTEIVARRAALGTQITELQQSIEDANLRADAAISATHVLDAAGTTASRERRQLVLAAVAGAVLCGAIAMASILFRRLTSERLRQRRDVATALGVPVRVAVGPLFPTSTLGRFPMLLRERFTRLLRGRARHWGQRTDRDLEALVQGLESAVPPAHHSRGTAGGGHAEVRASSGPATLGVAAIDRTLVAAVVVRALADRLEQRGVRVLLVDLTVSGVLRAAPGSGAHSRDGRSVAVFRPSGDPALACGPLGAPHSPQRAAADRQDLRPLWREADVVLVLADVDPGIDLDVLPTWVERIVPLVSAGRASRELLTTVAALLTGGGLEMPFALLEGADPNDQTLGRPAPTGEEPGRLAAVQSR